jgi:prepilin-type N-terminal cleavage/methylation domain-containing protein
MPSLRHNQRGMSLIELTIMLVVISILAAVAMKSMTSSIEDMRRVKTERELDRLADAIVGDPALTADGHRSDFGYVGDVGAFPPNLSALVTNPGYSTWNGPYVAAAYAEDTNGFKIDDWGNAYAYSGGLTISSSGHGTAITKKLADAASDYLLNSYSGTIKDRSDSVPGATKRDSVSIQVSFPNGAGGTTTKTYTPSTAGSFQLDSLPVGKHLLRFVYTPTHDTLSRFITILPRHRTGDIVIFKFGTTCFSSGS